MLLRTLCHSSSRQLYTGSKESIDSIKQFLKPYKSGTVDLEKKENGIAHIVLNNPERRNAFSGSMMVDLYEIVEELESWTVGRGLILRGADNKSKVFCSGGDLKTVHHIKTPEAGFMMSLLMSEATDRLARLPLVSVCLLQGPAVGGGAELTTATDYR